jgi:hypothetical protein
MEQGTAMAPLEAIRRYKQRANHEGFTAWLDVPVTESVRMHVPALGVEATGQAEIEEKIFGTMRQAGANQELVAIQEAGTYVVCILEITSNSVDAPLTAVEVFRCVDGAVDEIWLHLPI